MVIWRNADGLTPHIADGAARAIRVFRGTIGNADVLDEVTFTYNPISGAGWAARLAGAEWPEAVVIPFEVGAVWGAFVISRRHADAKALGIGQHAITVTDAIFETGRPVAASGALVILRPLAGLGFKVPILPLRAQWRWLAAHGDVVGNFGRFALQGAGTIRLAG
ncbi:hypothetical protein AU05_22295 [Ectopseudomonas composti]|uniref:Uncharacterized protein n=1 Tax=Ectopseudomonas composti TaxID=658457 RepID=A0ABP3BTG3_9GAMM|nr:hypothetical protein AU05_22295 [Pseudomonas composti]